MTSRPDRRPTPWSVLVYRVSNQDRQQSILQAFHDIDRPGVLALGTGAVSDPHVVVESPSMAAEVYSRRVVLRIDPSARSVDAASHSAPTTAASLLLFNGGRRAVDAGPEGRP